ncbi:hypothetical protein [Phenylobacterium sp.]|uniref:hypothetical protein n=1 Tax=Phenylobacterium sp. TaxID=1871053 RepID=UPI002F95BBB0
MPLAAQPLGDMVEAVAADAPAPGSGAAAAVALALAAACAAKAFTITARRLGGDAGLAAAAEEARGLADEALAAGDRDAAGFEAFVAKAPGAAGELVEASDALGRVAERLAALCRAQDAAVRGSLEADIDAALSLAAAAAAIGAVNRAQAEKAG